MSTVEREEGVESDAVIQPLANEQGNMRKARELQHASQQRDSFIESKAEVNLSSYFLTKKLTKRFYCNSYSDLTVTDV